MFLEILTLLVLALVILIKYATAKHIGALNHEKLELENVCRYNEGLYRQLSQERQNSEAEEESLKNGRSALETNLEELQQALAKQKERNQELGEQIN